MFFELCLFLKFIPLKNAIETVFSVIIIREKYKHYIKLLKLILSIVIIAHFTACFYHVIIFNQRVDYFFILNI